MDKIKSGVLIFITAFVIGSCETDFPIITEWKDITVVYGLLDQKDSVQYIKINKAFLGEGNALTFAQEYDSVNYPFPLNVWIEEINENGQWVQTINFDTITTYKPEDINAVFPTGAQLVYKGSPATYYEIHYIVEPPNDTIGFEKIWLNEKSTYKLFIQYPDSSKLITSETYLVQDFDITKPFPGSTTIKFVTAPALPYEISWAMAPNDVFNFKYEIELVFHYEELTFDNQLIQRTLNLASGVVYPQSGSDELYYYFWDNNFFSSCEDQIPYADPTLESNIKERHSGNVDIIVSSAAGEFNLFMQVYEPSTSIVQEKPPYTNIVNGIGIFSARYKKTESKDLNAETLNDLKAINNNILKFEF
jgi:hypothetical protein